MKISVLGAESQGIAIALLLEKNGHDVTVWSELRDEIAMLKTKREHEKCLPGIMIPERIHFTESLEVAMSECEIVVMAVEGPYLRSTAVRMKNVTKPGQIILNLTNAIKKSARTYLISIVKDEIADANVCILSGLANAEDIVKGKTTECVVTANDKETEAVIQKAFMNENLKVYTSKEEKRQIRKKSIPKYIVAGIVAIIFAISARNSFLLVNGSWYGLYSVEIDFKWYGKWIYHNDGSPCGNSDVYSHYIVVGDKIIVWGLGADIIDIKDINWREMTLEIEGYEDRFINDKSRGLISEKYEGEDKKVFKMLLAGEWKSVTEELRRKMEIDFEENTIYCYNFIETWGYRQYYYQFLGDGIIEIEYGNEIERITVVEISDNKLILNIRGVDIEFVNEP